MFTCYYAHAMSCLFSLFIFVVYLLLTNKSVYDHVIGFLVLCRFEWIYLRKMGRRINKMDKKNFKHLRPANIVACTVICKASQNRHQSKSAYRFSGCVNILTIWLLIFSKNGFACAISLQIYLFNTRKKTHTKKIWFSFLFH